MRDEGVVIAFNTSSSSSSSSAADAHTAATTIDSSNIGFQLLKKHGWKEGTGLGLSQQGRLEPVQAYLKNNKRGLGADRPKKPTFNKKPPPSPSPSPTPTNKEVPVPASKPLSKKQKKMQELEKRLQDKEFERAFYRQFWPDNV